MKGKRYVLFVIIMITGSLIWGQKNEGYTSTLNGSVKTVSEKCYKLDVEDGVIVKKRLNRDIYLSAINVYDFNDYIKTFNKNGTITEEKTFSNYSGNIQNIIEYYYNSSGYIISIKTSRSNKYIEQVDSIVYGNDSLIIEIVYKRYNDIELLRTRAQIPEFLDCVNNK